MNGINKTGMWKQEKRGVLMVKFQELIKLFYH